MQSASSKKKCQVWVILEAAEATRVPAGGALADREGFASRVPDSTPWFEVIRDETRNCQQIYSGCKRPLNQWCLAEKIHAKWWMVLLLRCSSPDIDVDIVDMNKVYLKSRYG